VPALPGAPLVFLGLLAAAWAEDFHRVGPVTLVILAALAALTIVVDIVATALGAKRTGASKAALLGAMLGSIVGLFLGLPGIVIGPFVGALLGEFAVRRDWSQAGRAGLGTWLGLALGTAVKIAIVFMMLGIFGTVYFMTG
jgi:uncharacterized protein